MTGIVIILKEKSMTVEQIVKKLKPSLQIIGKKKEEVNLNIKV